MINVYFTELPKTLTEILELKYDESMSYEDRVQKRYDYIKKQYELDSKYEGWDYLENVKYRLKFELLTTFEYMISTKGRILTLFMREGKYKVLKGTVTTIGYKKQELRIDRNIFRLKPHRALSSTFIPKPSHYKQGINRLVVNHKDLIKLNNHFTNLEWCTQQENTIHQYTEHKNKNVYFNTMFEGTVEVDCKYKGIKFKVFGSNGLREIGMSSSGLAAVFSKGNNLSFGCSWKIITKEEATKLPNIPEFIKNKIMHDKKYLDIRTTPLKGTVIKDCVYKDLSFIVYGEQEIKNAGFDRVNIIGSMTAGKMHKGCLFEYVSRDEAELFQRGLTNDQVNIIARKQGTKLNI